MLTAFVRHRAADTGYQRPTILDLLTTLVRNGTIRGLVAEAQDEVRQVDSLQARLPAVQAAMRVLGRMPRPPQAKIELPNVDLRRADLAGADLEDAIFVDANLAGAVLLDANLVDALLVDTDLRGAILEDADLSDAILEGANLSGAVLWGADLSGAALGGADLSGAKSDASTRWPHDFDPTAADVDVGMR